jgi:hypothetical protein
VRTQNRNLRHQLAPPSQALDIANLVARPKRFELLTPRFVVLSRRFSQAIGRTRFCR